MSMTEMEWRRFNDLGARLALQDPSLARALSSPASRDLPSAPVREQTPLALSLTVSLLVWTLTMLVLFVLTSLGVGSGAVTAVALAEVVACWVVAWLILRRRRPDTAGHAARPVRLNRPGGRRRPRW